MTPLSWQALRKKRLQAMQKNAQLKKELLAKGHGKYTELEDEKVRNAYILESRERDKERERRTAILWPLWP